jgi:hypothetical protein
MGKASGRAPGCRNSSASWSAPSSAYVRRIPNDPQPGDRAVTSARAALAFSRFGRSVSVVQDPSPHPPSDLMFSKPVNYAPRVSAGQSPRPLRILPPG